MSGNVEFEITIRQEDDPIPLSLAKFNTRGSIENYDDITMTIGAFFGIMADTIGVETTADTALGMVTELALYMSNNMEEVKRQLEAYLSEKHD